MSKTRLQKYFDLMTTAGQDITFVTERAIHGSFNERQLLDTRQRAERIITALEHSTRIVDGYDRDTRQLLAQVSAMQGEVVNAIKGLQAFLVAISQMEMGEATRVTVQEQIDLIGQALESIQAQHEQDNRRANGTALGGSDAVGRTVL